MTDEEYLTAALRARKGEQNGAEPGFDPAALVRWTPEVRVLADLVDEVRMLRATVIASVGGSSKTPPRYDRPRTALDKARFSIAKEKHEKLVARVLPHREET